MLVGVRDVHGVTHDVSPAGPSPVTLASGGVDGLVTKPEVVASTSGFVPGRLVHGLTTPPVEGQLRLLVDANPGYRAVAAWFSFRKLAEIIVGDWSLPVRLGGPVPPPEVAPDGEPLVEMTVPLVGDGGVWLSPVHTGDTIENTGDVPVWPTITWSGTAAVAWPSGMVTTLPAVTAESVLDTAPESGLVVRTGGVVNVPASKSVEAFTEPVMPGETAHLGLTNCKASWRIGRWSPWL